MEIDLNIDEFNKSIITRNSFGTSVTTDTEYWQLRNYLLNKFKRNNSFWKQFKNIKINNRVDLEKNIEKSMLDFVSEEVKNKIKIVVLITGRKAEIYLFQLINDVNQKDKLLFDFDVTV